VLLEVQAQVQERLPQHAVVVQDERDQQPPDAPVPIEKAVDGLELHVGERRTLLTSTGNYVNSKQRYSRLCAWRSWLFTPEPQRLHVGLDLCIQP
jgi:hypothetical protein